MFLLFLVSSFLTLASCEFLVQAIDLLQKNQDNAKASLQVLAADIHFLRDQVTLTQV
ncbi:hypothetical protein GLYMA_07G158050v4 [Glycine max]|nr:hypothetical protein GLYMA_07G158050v4 [Glycine max]KAH1087060.1 hypothetical protein GYH30_018542 [Glycine max]